MERKKQNSLFVDGITLLYRKILRNLPINKVQQVWRIQGPIYKNWLHFYTYAINKPNEIKKMISFTIASIRIKSLEINLTNMCKTYSETYRTLWKEITENANIWGNIPCSWVGRFLVLKWHYSSNLQIQYPSWLLCRNLEADSKIHTEFQRARRTKTFLKKKNEVGGFQLVDFKTY